MRVELIHPPAHVDPTALTALRPAWDLFDLDGYHTLMLTHSRWVSDDCNFCEHISSNGLSLYKYWIVASYLIETKRRMLSRARA